MRWKARAPDTVAHRHALVAKLGGEASVRQLCELWGVNRGWFYAAAIQPPSAEETALRDRIEESDLELPGYGYRRAPKLCSATGGA